MKKLITTLLFICLGIVEMHSQISISLQTGYNTVEKPNLNELNQSLLEALPFQAGIVDDFPDYVYFQGAFLIYLQNFDWGINMAYTSTGSRISYEDYSGNYTQDNFVSAFNIGFLIQKRFRLSGKHQGIIFLEGGSVISFLTIEENILIGEVNENYKYDFENTSFYISPGIKYQYPVYDFLRVGLSLSYFLDLNKEYHLKNNDNAILTLENSGTKVKSNWDGIRFGILAEFYIKSIFKIEEPEYGI